MPRTALGLVVAVVALLSPGPAWPCSVLYGPDIERNPVLSPGAEFRMWLPNRGGRLGLDLFDEADRLVPADVAAYAVPLERFYRSPGQYVVLKPRQRLAPGGYRLTSSRAGLSLRDAPQILVVDSGQPYSRPPAPGKLRARLLQEQCRVNTNADCSAMLGDCAFLVLDFEDPGKDERSVYDVRWQPVIRGKADSARAGGSPGYRSEAVAAGRAIRVPIWVFEDLDATDTTLRVELRALDAEGNASAPAVAEVDAVDLLAAARRLASDDPKRPAVQGPRSPIDVRAVDDRYVEDVARFARAAADTDTAEILALLSGASPSPGRQNDEAFQRAVLSQPARVEIRGRLRDRATTTVTAWATVRAERVRLMDAGPLRAAIAQLSFDMPEVERVELRTFESGGGHVQAQLFLSDGDFVLGSWGPRTPAPDLRGEVERKSRARAIVDGHPVFRELVAGYGRPSRRSGDSVSWFGPDTFRTVRASFEIGEGRVDRVRLVGPLAVLRVGPFLALLDGVVTSAALRLDAQRSPNVTMTVAEDGTVEGELGDPPNLLPFKGRVDLAQMRTANGTR